MKRSPSRAVVERLARSDVRGGARPRRPTAVAIRDGELAAGLSRNELVLHYQPIVDLRSGECRRVEALLRWRHPRLGLLEPGDFLPFASAFIEQIGVWVVRAAAAQWTEWRALGPGLGIGINVSAPELARVDVFLEALAPFGSGSVTFELTPAKPTGWRVSRLARADGLGRLLHAGGLRGHGRGARGGGVAQQHGGHRGILRQRGLSDHSGRIRPYAEQRGSRGLHGV